MKYYVVPPKNMYGEILPNQPYKIYARGNSKQPVFSHKNKSLVERKCRLLNKEYERELAYAAGV